VRRTPLPRAGFAVFQIELIAELGAADGHLPGQDADTILAVILGEIAPALTPEYRIKAQTGRALSATPSPETAP
jgi:hypothetical protein